MTKSRSKSYWAKPCWARPYLARRGGAIIGLVLLFGLSGCVTRSGVPLEGALPADINYAYIPLKRPSAILPENDAGAVVLGDGVAVTAAHATDMVPAALLIGASHDYDLAFFRSDRDKAVLAQVEPRLGAKVVAYAHYGTAVYRAEGVITALNAPVVPRCETCAKQTAFTFEGNAGPGFSGGPVIDAESGRLVGILFGYLDREDGKRVLFAYPMERVREELKKVLAQ